MNMEITRTARAAREVADVKMWHCAGCGVVHLSVKDTVLNFSRDDFATFTQTAVEINYSGWEMSDPYSLLDLGEHDTVIHADAVVN